jgi:hypothetical protein
VQKDVLHGSEPMDVAPNGRELAFSAFDFGGPNVQHQRRVARRGGRSGRFSDVPAEEFGGLAYLAPDGHELVYVARSSNLHTHDIRALDVITGRTRADRRDLDRRRHLRERLGGARRQAHRVCPAGRDGHDQRPRGRDRRARRPRRRAPARAQLRGVADVGPHGRRLLIERDAGDGVVRPVIVDLGGRPDVVIETEISDNAPPSSGHPTGRRSSPSDWAADNRPLQQELWDARTGSVTPVSWPS